MAEPPYSSPTSFPPINYDPLIVDPGFPLDEHSMNLARDFIAPVVIPHYYAYGPNQGVTMETEYSPTSLGYTKVDGPTPVANYPGIPGFVARLDIASSLRTEFYTGRIYSPFDWMNYKYYTTYNRCQILAQNRDITSTIINLWGAKPIFEDDWFGLIRPTRPPNPRVDF